jgi:hypothetical protein
MIISAKNDHTSQFKSDVTTSPDNEDRQIFDFGKLYLPFVLRQPPLCDAPLWPGWEDIHEDITHLV